MYWTHCFRWFPIPRNTSRKAVWPVKVWIQNAETTELSKWNVSMATQSLCVVFANLRHFTWKTTGKWTSFQKPITIQFKILVIFCLLNRYDIMLNCWDENSINRASFTTLRKTFDAMLSSLASKVSVCPWMAVVCRFHDTSILKHIFCLYDTYTITFLFLYENFVFAVYPWLMFPVHGLIPIEFSQHIFN